MSSQEGLRAPTIIRQPSKQLDPSGLFWLEPSAIEAVDDLINSTKLSTMALGAETHANEMGDTRQQLEAALFSEDDPLNGELRRAFEIGFMYGGLIAKKSAPVTDAEQTGQIAAVADPKLVGRLSAGLESARENLDLSDNHDSHLFFTRLRRLELHLARSDVLAFSLSRTQDHMADEFAANHQPGDGLSRQEIWRMQSVYYAGALSGALLGRPAVKDKKPMVEIMRGMENDDDFLSLRLPIKPAASLIEDLEASLSSKLAFNFVTTGEDEPDYIATEAQVFQYGPNAVSKPVFIPGYAEPDLLLKTPVEEIEAALVSYATEAGDEQLALFTGSLEDHGLPVKDIKIVGMLTDKYLVSAFDKAHPNADVVIDMANKLRGDDGRDFSYVCAMSLPEAPKKKAKPLVGKKAGGLAVGAMAGVWAVDVLGSELGQRDVSWETNSLASVLVFAGIMTLNRLYRRLQNADSRANLLLQDQLDQRTLSQ